MNNKYRLGDYNQHIQEIWYNEEEYIKVSYDDAEKICNLLNHYHNQIETYKAANQTLHQRLKERQTE